MKKQIGQQIKKFRLQKGYSQAALAEYVGISTDHLSTIERGLYQPRVTTLLRLLDVFDCSADELLAPLIKKAAPLHATQLWDKIAHLPHDEQQCIFDVLDAMIVAANDRQSRKK